MAARGARRRPMDAAGQRRAAELREVQRQPVARLLLQRVPQDPSERRLVRRARSRSVRQVPVRDVRRHPHSRRAGVRRPLRASWRWRAAPIRSTSSSSTGSICSSSRLGARPRDRRELAADRRARRRDQRPGAQNTILRADVGKSLLPARYRGRVVQRCRFMILKPLG